MTDDTFAQAVELKRLIGNCEDRICVLSSMHGHAFKVSCADAGEVIVCNDAALDILIKYEQDHLASYTNKFKAL
jgi:hypothetical protein